MQGTPLRGVQMHLFGTLLARQIDSDSGIVLGETRDDVSRCTNSPENRQAAKHPN